MALLSSKTSSAGNPYDMRSEDPAERSLAKKWEQQQANPLPVWSPGNVTYERQGDARSEDPAERALAKSSQGGINKAFADYLGIAAPVSSLSSMPDNIGFNKAMQMDDLLTRWSSNTNPDLPTLNMSPEQRRQVLQQLAASGGQDYKQFLTPEQRQVAQTYETYYAQNAKTDPFAKALMAGMIGGVGLLAAPSLMAGAGAAESAAAPTFTGGASGGGIAGEAVGGALSGGASAGAGTAAGTGAFNVADYISSGVLPGGGTIAAPALPAASGIGGAASIAASAGTALSRVINGTATAEDYLSLGITGAQTVGGVVAANQQSGALADLANRAWDMGAPSRARYEGSFAPGFDLAATDPAFQAALDQSAQTAARSWSARAGNPDGNPGVQAEINKYVLNSAYLPQLNTYRSQNATSGQFGTNLAGTSTGASINADGGAWEAIGAGLENIAPQRPNYGSAGGSLSRLLLNSSQYL